MRQPSRVSTDPQDIKISELQTKKRHNWYKYRHIHAWVYVCVYTYTYVCVIGIDIQFYSQAGEERVIFPTVTQLFKHGIWPGSSMPNISVIAFYRAVLLGSACGLSLAPWGHKSLAEGHSLILEAECCRSKGLLYVLHQRLAGLARYLTECGGWGRKRNKLSFLKVSVLFSNHSAFLFN